MPAKFHLIMLGYIVKQNPVYELAKSFRLSVFCLSLNVLVQVLQVCWEKTAWSSNLKLYVLVGHDETIQTYQHSFTLR